MPKPRIIRKKAEKPKMPSHMTPPKTVMETVYFQQNMSWWIPHQHNQVVKDIICAYELDFKDGLFVPKLCAGKMLDKFLEQPRLKQIELNNEWSDLPGEHDQASWVKYLEDKLGK